MSGGTGEARRTIHLIRHDDYELPGSIEAWAAAREASVHETLFFRGDEPAPARRGERIVLMGGAMSANGDAALPWLRPEKRWVAEAIGSGASLLGICLGSQILANVLGARVRRSAHLEIGWFPVLRAPEAEGSRFAHAIPAAHDSFLWHSETFDLPPGAVRLATSRATENQAFAWGDHVIGVQFHPEMTVDGARAIVEHSSGEIVPGPYVQDPDEFLPRAADFDALARVMHGLLDALFAEP